MYWITHALKCIGSLMPLNVLDRSCLEMYWITHALKCIGSLMPLNVLDRSCLYMLLCGLQDVETAQQYFNRRMAFLQKNADQIAEALQMKRNAYGGMLYTSWWWLYTGLVFDA